MGESIIRIQDVRKVYLIGKERVVAVGRISLDISKGEICCILGPSGSGKSTLLNIMAGLERPSRGKIVIGGTDVTRFSEKKWALFRQGNIGFVFQSYNLMPTMTAVENVALPLTFCGMNREKRTRMAVQMLKAVHLGSRLMHRPTQMSGGQQQRVGIARAFIAHPKIVFADEPTGNLDTKTSREVMELMVAMAKKYGETLVIVTHDPDIAKYADRILTIRDGRLLSDKPNHSVYGNKEEQAV
ncbi:MAG: ABC transporter ATP-binding protein [Oscillospiraceae bacterium]|jgi:putative ABC transport system ATP-binding protein|nr:ABC transporter ATP-binding protein [Oscillospiraceae bacterium]